MELCNEYVLNENKKVDPENNFTDGGNMNSIFTFGFEDYVLKWQRKVSSTISFSVAHSYEGCGIYKYTSDTSDRMISREQQGCFGKTWTACQV